MFSKKTHLDVKKSSQKVLDSKKDSLSRLKHLKIVLENLDLFDAKTFFENNYSHIYYIFYDVFINVENNLKQRAHHRTHRDEFDVVKYMLEKLLVLLPELLHRRWQCHSVGRIMKKFLHYGNSTKLRREGIRLFLLWYQILGDNAPDELDVVFTTLVPGIVPGVPNPYLAVQNTSQGHGFFNRSQNSSVDGYQETSTFYASSVETVDSRPVNPSEIFPIVPTLPTEQQPDDHTVYFLDCLLELMISQVCRVEWHDKSEFKAQKCFHFLFEKFKKYYLPHLFPKFSDATNLYKPVLALPQLRHESDIKFIHESNRFAQKDSLQHCQAIFIRWVTHFTQCLKKSSVTFQQQTVNEVVEHNDINRPTATDADPNQSAPNFLTAAPVSLDRDPSSTSLSNDELSYRDYTIVRDTLYSSRKNINFVHEIFRQAFLMHFTYSSTMRKVVAVYREWIQKNTTEKPIFLEEPPTKPETDSQEDRTIGDKHTLLNSAVENTESDVTAIQEQLYLRLRKDSYLKAIHCDYGYLKAGLQNMLNVFITNAANVFLLGLTTDNLQLLEEQVDMCKRVLNIYRYMVMNAQMERRVWEQLLLVLLQITSLVLKEIPPSRKENTLGGRLAPALFQTLIVTWIKANLNVVISTDLWDQFLQVLSSLTQWEELIKEWAKTMETLTRVLAKQVYSLDLNDLPLERLSEQKMKKTRGIKKLSMGVLEDRSLKNSHKTVRSTFQGNSDYDETSSHDTETDRGCSHQAMRSRSDSGSSHKRCIHSEQGLLQRSASDSNLHRQRYGGRIAKEILSSSSTHKQALIVTGASPCTDEELSHITPSFDEEIEVSHTFKSYSRQKSKSLDFLSHRAESPCFSESSECHSRSPSPTPSSGLESTSIKDSPMQIDVLVSNTENTCNTEVNNLNNIEARSVMSGGTTRGWLPDVAVVLWKRMLGALGNINHIADPSIHAQVLKYLVDLSELLIKIRDNLGVTVDNLSSPPPPELVPPFLIITPWLFQAINLPDRYKEGKLLAYKLLCLLSLCRHDVPFSYEYLMQFYEVLHYGLICADQDVINFIVQSCPKFFAMNLPGCTLMLMDFMYAVDTIVSSNGLKGVPRTEAISILGALLCFPNIYQEIRTFTPYAVRLSAIRIKDAKDQITDTLFKAAKREPAGLARCIAISSIGIYLYEELKNATNHFRIKEAIAVLLIAIRFNCKAVAQVATDMLLLLCDHAQYLLENYVDLVRKIVEVLSSTLGNLLPNPDVPVGEEDKKIILSLIYCLGEWCMHLEQSFLTEVWSPLLSEECHSPLFSVFKVLYAAATGTRNIGNCAIKSMIELTAGDVDPTILLDNFHEGTSSSPSALKVLSNTDRPQADNSFFRSFIDPQHNHDVIKLAAKNVINHLVNHLGHFPMGVGAVRLTSLVNEHDDVPFLTGDELSAEVFHAPNIQFFVVNNSSIVSFVEIPSLDLPGGGATAGLTTSKSQVRAIVRDLSGKFSWDCSILYGLPDHNDDFFPAQQDHSLALHIQAQSMNYSLLNNSIDESPYSDTALEYRTTNVLPTVENSIQNLDNLGDLLQYVGQSSPECISNPSQVLNAPLKMPNEQDREKEIDIMNMILSQHNLECSQINKYSQSSSMDVKCVSPPHPCEDSFPFQHCRLLLNQLGFTLWEKRSSCDLLKKNEQLLRELRNLDKQKCRETHKIAVIYVAKGQEDKTSILSNSGGSQEFEDFVAGLGWEVELENHLGFLGGLQRNKSTGDTAPYFATSFVEVIFHVSTRMCVTQDKDSINKKVRHLGNDEVHIVWSEHTRDYRKEIIATEFCDVLIVIYPIGGRLYKIHITRKTGVPFFGPLFTGAIVEHKVLASLVRATAINANRAKRSLVSLYMNFYEERAKSLEIIVQNHKDKTTFEQFAASIYSPAPTKSHTPSRSSGPPSRADSACSKGIPNLAAALLDAHSKGSGYSPSLRSRPASQSTSEGISPHSSPQTSLRDRPLSASHSQS